MGTSSGAVGRRWWLAAAIVAVLVTVVSLTTSQRAFALELRMLPDDARLSAPAVLFLAAVMTAIAWGLCLLWAALAAIALRRLAAPAPAFVDVVAIAICAQIPLLVSSLLNARNLRSAEAAWDRGGDTTSPEAIYEILQPGLFSDLLSTVGVAVVFGALLQLRYRDLPGRAVAVAALAPIVVTLVTLVLSIAAP